MKTDIQIAQQAKKLPIGEIAAGLGLSSHDIEPYGSHKAKLTFQTLERLSKNKKGKLILVTAISPTPAGEGKTTTTIGLGQGMAKIGKNAVVALREPSLGPVFGVKGGATGGGYSQVLPMEDINLHFTGDFHAITSANNLLCAMLDNHIQQGNELGINPKRVLLNRALDMNDRVLRRLIVGLGGSGDGVMREDSFSITVATEMMAILCLSENLNDLKDKCGKIIVAYDYDGNPVTAAQLGANGAMAALMRDAVKPNLVQTTENTPCLIHGGPFANIAHGCNSIIATRAAMGLGDYCITEAGFGSDLGAQKFFDIKCRMTGLMPSVVVVVATIRALKYNGGVSRDELAVENLEALKSGAVNLKAHVENMKNYNIPIVVALNRFHTDTAAEVELVMEYCQQLGVKAVQSQAFALGGDGATELAHIVCELCEGESQFKLLYANEDSLTQKIETIAQKIYHASKVEFTQTAINSIKKAESMGYSDFPVCIAKTQYSLSDDPKKLGCPEGNTIHIRDIKVSAGAGFVVAYAGDIMTMPGLPKRPAAEKIDIDTSGNITGLN